MKKLMLITCSYLMYTAQAQEMTKTEKDAMANKMRLEHQKENAYREMDIQPVSKAEYDRVQQLIEKNVEKMAVEQDSDKRAELQAYVRKLRNGYVLKEENTPSSK